MSSSANLPPTIASSVIDHLDERVPDTQLCQLLQDTQLSLEECTALGKIADRFGAAAEIIRTKISSTIPPTTLPPELPSANGKKLQKVSEIKTSGEKNWQYFLEKKKLRRASTFLKNLIMIFHEPQATRLDSKRIADRKAVTRGKCHRIRRRSPNEIISWAIAFTPSVWSEYMDSKTFDYFLQYIDFMCQPVAPWPQDVREALQYLQSNELKGNQEFESFMKQVSTADQRIGDIALPSVFWALQNAQADTLSNWFADAVVSRIQQQPEWATNSRSSSCLVAAHWKTSGIEFVIDWESRRENDNLLQEADVFKAQPWGSIVGWKITRQLVIHTSWGNGAQSVSDSMFPQARRS